MKKRNPLITLLLTTCLLLTVLASPGQTVYKTPSGNRYHLVTCRSVKNVSEKLSLAEAHKGGLTACLVCKPASLTGIQGVKSVQGETSTVQCHGQTKAGSRCKHKTSIGNGFCYQHQPG